MTVTDISTLLAPVSAELPCGEDLAGERLLLEAETQGKHDPENPHRTQPPDWVKVREQAEELLQRSKDLKVAVIYLQALIATQGIAGLADGLSLLRELLEQYWDGLYPPIDEDGDPFERAMALQVLADSYVDGQDASDSVGMVAFSFRRLPLIRLPGLGEFSFRDIKLARRQWRFFVKPDTPHPKPSEIDGALRDCALDDLQATREALQQAETDLGAMDIFLKQRVTEDTPSFQQLLRDLTEARKVLEEALQKRGGTPVAVTPADEVSAVSAGQPEPPGVETIPVPAAPGEIRSRRDVLETLDRLCEYYRRHEPSSPLPLLLNRAKRLVDMDFLAILADLAPAGLDQARVIQGATGEAASWSGDSQVSSESDSEQSGGPASDW